MTATSTSKTTVLHTKHMLFGTFLLYPLYNHMLYNINIYDATGCKGTLTNFISLFELVCGS